MAQPKLLYDLVVDAMTVQPGQSDLIVGAKDVEAPCACPQIAQRSGWNCGRRPCVLWGACISVITVILAVSVAKGVLSKRSMHAEVIDVGTTLLGEDPALGLAGSGL